MQWHSNCVSGRLTTLHMHPCNSVLLVRFVGMLLVLVCADLYVRTPTFSGPPMVLLFVRFSPLVGLFFLLANCLLAFFSVGDVCVGFCFGWRFLCWPIFLLAISLLAFLNVAEILVVVFPNRGNSRWRLYHLVQLCLTAARFVPGQSSKSRPPSTSKGRPRPFQESS